MLKLTTMIDSEIQKFESPEMVVAGPFYLVTSEKYSLLDLDSPETLEQGNNL